MSIKNIGQAQRDIQLAYAQQQGAKSPDQARQAGQDTARINTEGQQKTQAHRLPRQSAEDKVKETKRQLERRPEYPSMFIDKTV